MKPSKRFVPDEAQIAKALRREITPRSREIIATIHRYRVIPASMLVRIIAGDPRVTKDHLTVLYRKGLINRFTFSKYDLSEEFNYYVTLRGLQGGGTRYCAFRPFKTAKSSITA